MVKENSRTSNSQRRGQICLEKAGEKLVWFYSQIEGKRVEKLGRFSQIEKDFSPNMPIKKSDFPSSQKSFQVPLKINKKISENLF